MEVKKRWISLYVENQIGVLAKISGMFAAKSYNRNVVVIKVIDISEVPIHKKELLYIKVNSCSDKDKSEIFRIAQAFSLDIIDYSRNSVLVQCVKTEDKNNDMIALFNKTFINRIEVVRGGSVAVEALSVNDR